MDSIIRDHEAAWSAAQVPRTCGWRLLPTRLRRAKSTDPPCGSRQSLNNRIHSYEKLYFERAQDGSPSPASNGFLHCPPGHLPAQHQNRAPGTRLRAPQEELSSLQHKWGLCGRQRTLEEEKVLGPLWKNTSYPVTPAFLGNTGQVIYTEIFTGGY